jgi:8-oxo-dGTP diphosphatase
MNPFESGQRKSIPAVLIYARHGDRVLMIHRNGKPGDYHSGKWNGLGGKCDLNESPQETAQREFQEEAGLSLPLERFAALGTLTFPNFKAHRQEDWIAFVFTVELNEEECSQVSTSNPEGELHWIPAQDLLSLNLWPGDRHFIPYVVEGKPFLGTIWYQGQDVLRASVSLYRATTCGPDSA